MSNKPSSAASIAATILDNVGDQVAFVGAQFDGPAGLGTSLANSALDLAAALIRAFGDEAPVKIAEMRDAVKARIAADERVDKTLLEEFDIDMDDDSAVTE